MIENKESKIQFRIELILALIVTGLACAAGFSNLLFASNELGHPIATDLMGHMAKVQYIAQSIKEGIAPTWFPYWYCGTPVTQYYPPLSYLLMVPIYAFAENVTLSFKIYCFIVLFSGGIGVWFFCRTYIGKWCGLFGCVVFCLQPYTLQTLFTQGQIAQGPIIALTPWYLLAIISYSQRPTVRKFLLMTLICFLMILSHPNSIFMFAICIIAALTVLFPFRKVAFQEYFFICLSIVLAGIMSGFWSLVGVIQLETPGIPTILGEAVMAYSATMEWFLNPNNFFYFAVPTSAASIAAVLMFAYRTSLKRTGKDEEYHILFMIMLTIFTIAFSFGTRIPAFKYLPMGDSMVAGRILNLTAVSAAILCAYLIYQIHNLACGKKIFIKVFASLVCITLIAATIINMNPFERQYPLRSEANFKDMISSVDFSGDNFKKGRYSYIGPFDSSQNYLPIQYDFNIAEGFNIEGTPHNQAIWNTIIANSSGNEGYIAKNMAYWNVRYILIFGSYSQVSDELNVGYNFQAKYNIGGTKFYASDYPSSYFLTDNRNALLFGAGSPGLAMEFPYLIHDQRNDIFDYTIEELDKYKLIYLCEPSVDSLMEKEKSEAMIKELVSKGVKVLIEPANTKGYELFDVAVSEVELENTPIIRKQINSKIDSTVDNIEVDESMKYGRAMFGLDRVYYKLVQNAGSLENDIIGVKNVGNGEVVFIGKHLSQYLKAVYTRNWGMPKNES
ncbi:MAG: 6-pyruvoyl-tetrahydropterin synthase-related protein, partial [Eubacteriales bacterium]|nr:6-pyruvoyl-tetrahydropterin synthase-related protein [Eubacteriales bacterium]